MSIKEDKDKSKTLAKLGLVDKVYHLDIPLEEEFDIVPTNEVDRSGIAKHLATGLIMLLIAVGSYGIGRLSYFNSQKVQSEITIIKNEKAAVLSSAEVSPVQSPVAKKNSSTKSVSPVVQAPKAIPLSTDGTVVASKNGTKYYYPSCSGANRILDKNKVYYSSTEEARKAGLLPSTTCKGLK